MPIIVLDGAYSARPELADLLDLSILLTLEDQSRRNRLLAREGREYMRRWHAIWDPAEDHYFTHLRPEHAFDILIPSR